MNATKWRSAARPGGDQERPEAAPGGAVNAAQVLSQAMTDAATAIEFVTAVPGFPDARAWTLAPWGDDPDSPFKLLSADDVEGLAFVVATPHAFFPAYEPVLDDATVDALGLRSAEEAAVYVVLTLGESIEDTTANLLGPVVVNTTRGTACQAVLHQPGLSTKTPLAGD